MGMLMEGWVRWVGWSTQPSPFYIHFPHYPVSSWTMWPWRQGQKFRTDSIFRLPLIRADPAKTTTECLICPQPLSSYPGTAPREVSQLLADRLITLDCFCNSAFFSLEWTLTLLAFLLITFLSDYVCLRECHIRSVPFYTALIKEFIS